MSNRNRNISNMHIYRSMGEYEWTVNLVKLSELRSSQFWGDFFYIRYTSYFYIKVWLPFRIEHGFSSMACILTSSG